MKLKEGFILHDVGGEHMVVASGEAAKHFNGMARNNGTADFIFRQLMEETSQDAVIDAVVKEYDAPRAVVASDVANLISKLREAGFLDE